jgi:MYXO-CTERM domain-containing protein
MTQAIRPAKRPSARPTRIAAWACGASRITQWNASHWPTAVSRAARCRSVFPRWTRAVSCSGDLGGQECDCGDASIDIPSDAVKTPCSSVPEPPFCGLDAGDAGGCPPPIRKEGSSCLCWDPKMCLLTPTPACATAADCPSHFTCTSCASLETFGGGTGTATGTATDTGTGTSPGGPGTGTKPKGSSTPDASPTSSTAGGGCAVVPGSESGEMGSGLVALGLALAARRRRARGTAHR